MSFRSFILKILNSNLIKSIHARTVSRAIDAQLVIMMPYRCPFQWELIKGNNIDARLRSSMPSGTPVLETNQMLRGEMLKASNSLLSPAPGAFSALLEPPHHRPPLCHCLLHLLLLHSLLLNVTLHLCVQFCHLKQGL